MPTFHGQTVDVSEGFEGAFPNTGWTETDASGKLSQSATAVFEGTNGMLYDYTGAADAYLTYDTGADRTSLSLGCWFRMPAYAAFGGLGIIVSVLNTATDQVLRICAGRNAGDNSYQIAVRANNGTFSTAIGLSPSTWYWLTAKLVNGGNLSLNVYDTSQTLVGAQTVACGAFSGRTVIVGAYSGFAAAANTYWDDIVIDYTAAAFPLLGWATGVTGTGAVTAEPATASASGSPVASGAAAPSAPAATVSGAGTPTITGTAAPSAPAATADGTGTPRLTGGSEGEAPPADVDGEGTPVIAGTGSVSAQPASVAASGWPVATGTASVSDAPATAAAAGTPVITGSGAATAAPADVSGSGAEPGPITGDGAVSAPPATVDASGTPIVAGSGTAQAPAPTAAGAGTPVSVGQGAVSSEPGSGVGSGTPVISGTAAVTAPAASVQASEEAQPVYDVIVAAAVRTSRTGVTAVRSGY